MPKKLSKQSVALLKKSLASKNRQIELDNKKFDKMSASEKRVQIARDVLAQLAAERLIATPGTWLAGPYRDDLFSKKDMEKNTELQKILKNTKKCTGCALGGMFMCAVKRADKLKLNQLSHYSQWQRQIQDEDVFSYMKKFFSREQLGQIESAFEQVFIYPFDTKASEWLANIDDASERMRLIMENIVANKGKFVLDKPPVLAWTTPGFKG